MSKDFFFQEFSPRLFHPNQETQKFYLKIQENYYFLSVPYTQSARFNNNNDYKKNTILRVKLSASVQK